MNVGKLNLQTETRQGILRLMYKANLKALLIAQLQ